MSQDYNPVLGTTLVSDLDDKITGNDEALKTLFSGATEPEAADRSAYMLWADTTTGLLKIRNAANSAWVTVGTMADVTLGLLSRAGGTMTGNIAMGGTQKLTGLAAGSGAGDSLRYEQLIGLYLLLAGGTMAGAIAMGTNKITGMGDPTAAQDAATKTYVDGKLKLVGTSFDATSHSTPSPASDGTAMTSSPVTIAANAAPAAIVITATARIVSNAGTAAINEPEVRAEVTVKDGGGAATVVDAMSPKPGISPTLMVGGSSAQDAGGTFTVTIALLAGTNYTASNEVIVDWGKIIQTQGTNIGTAMSCTDRTLTVVAY